MHLLHSLAGLSLLSFTSARLNDWSLPCDGGECSWDMPTAARPNGRVNMVSRGSMRIWGNTSALADITTAAGWQILDCNATAWNQEIRIVCPDASQGCNNLFSGLTRGVNKLVRLPDNCGKMPFARVARVWTHQNQAIPSSLNTSHPSSHVRPIVHGLAIDTNFAAIDPATSGEVNIAIQGTNLPSDNSSTVAQRRSLEERGIFDFIQDALNRFNSIDLSQSETLDPVQVNRDLNIFDESITCSLPDGASIDAGIKLDVSADASAQVTLGIVATGTIIPPVLNNFNVYAGLNADLKGTLDLRANAGAKLNSGDLTLFQVGIPGLNFPGILSVGPSFAIKARATAGIEADVDLSVDLTYKTDDTVLFFPPSDQFSSRANFSTGDSNLELSVSPDASITGNVEVHLIPEVSIDIDALSLAKANVFLNLDSSATIDATLKASAIINKNLLNSTQPTNTTGSSFSGCFNIGAGLDVNAGADASFFGLFDQGTKVSLFSKDFDIFEKCFGGGVSTKEKRRALESHRQFQRRHRPSWRNAKRQDDSVSCLPSFSSDLTNLLTIS